METFNPLVARLLLNPWVHIAVLAVFTTIVAVSDNAMWDRKPLTGIWKLIPLFKSKES